MAEAATTTTPTPVQTDNQDIAIEVDNTIEDTDSSYGDEISAYTASLTSSVNNFFTEYGRQFHSYHDRGGNVFPSDSQEEERQDMLNMMMLKLMDGKTHFAPIDSNLQRALDIGTGTGTWAIDFVTVQPADQYPSAEVVASDLQPIQSGNVPPNLRFMIDDFEDDWGYENHPFDFIHARYLATTVKDWPRLVKQAHDCTKPGGWVEFQDWDALATSSDGTVTEKSAMRQFCVETVKRRDAAGYNCRPGIYLEKWLKDAGFVNVRAHALPVPIGSWPKDKKYKQVGAWNYHQFDNGLEGVGIGCLARTPGDTKPWSLEEIQVLCARARAEMKDRKIHSQLMLYVAYGQKPQA